MRVLIITANPSKKGFTHHIARTYKKSSKDAGHKVEVIDLYKTKLKQDFVRFENIANWPINKNRTKWQKKIKSADRLVIIHPLWWFDAPAILKNWFDQNFTSGFAYRMQRSGFPKKLLKGKTAHVFITADGPGWFYRMIFQPFRRNWILGRLGFCGYKVNKFKVLYRKRFRDQKYLDNYLKKVAQIASLI